MQPEFVSACFECSLTELLFQIAMSVPEPTKNPIYPCMCGCGDAVTRWTEVRHLDKPELESPPPPKWHRIADFQAGQESLIVRPGKQKWSHNGKQKRSHTDNSSSPSHSRADASSSSSDYPQLHAPSCEFNPFLPLLDPSPASNLLQLPSDALAEASSPSVDDILLNLHAQAH